jgi:hypothetical protein
MEFVNRHGKSVRAGPDVLQPGFAAYGVVLSIGPQLSEPASWVKRGFHPDVRSNTGAGLIASDQLIENSRNSWLTSSIELHSLT